MWLQGMQSVSAGRRGQGRRSDEEKVDRPGEWTRLAWLVLCAVDGCKLRGEARSPHRRQEDSRLLVMPSRTTENHAV